MKIHFLGTGASEGIPNPHCTCEVCEKSRDLGGRNIRTRSSVIIDDELKVDDPQDTFYQSVRDNINLTGLKELLITHTHADHFNPGDMINRIEGFAHGVDEPLHIYGHDLAVKGYGQQLPSKSGRFIYHHVLPFKQISSRTAAITPLLADHDQRETCLLYFIEKDGKNILYGNDTGWFPDETWDWLKYQKIDLAILDCTGGFNNDKRSRNHMCIETVLEVQRVFKEQSM